MNFLGMVNAVLEELGWNEIAAGDFDSPTRPASALKRKLNEAKDEILGELGVELLQQEFALTTIAPILGATHGGTATFSAGASFSIAGPALPGAATQYINRKIRIAGAGDAWYRIVNSAGGFFVVDTDFAVAFAATTDWDLFQDEYDLQSQFRTGGSTFQSQPNRVRQVLSAWTSSGPLALDFVNEYAEIDRFFPGDTDLGEPREMAIFRGNQYESTAGGFSNVDTTPFICQLRPIPDAAYAVHFKAAVAYPDLDQSTDAWNIEQEVEALIRQRALIKVLNSPLQNDPDLALANQRDLDRQLLAKKVNTGPTMPSRRLRRRAPDEVRFARRNYRVVT